LPQDAQVAGKSSLSAVLPVGAPLLGPLPAGGPPLFFRAARQSLQRVGSSYPFSAKKFCSSALKIKLLPQSLHTMVISFLVISSSCLSHDVLKIMLLTRLYRISQKRQWILKKFPQFMPSEHLVEFSGACAMME
jgi:hypothetical protein